MASQPWPSLLVALVLSFLRLPELDALPSALLSFVVPPEIQTTTVPGRNLHVAGKPILGMRGCEYQGLVLRMYVRMYICMYVCTYIRSTASVNAAPRPPIVSTFADLSPDGLEETDRFFSMAPVAESPPNPRHSMDDGLSLSALSMSSSMSPIPGSVLARASLPVR